VLSRLTALEELHMRSNKEVFGDYKLAFPPSLQVCRRPCECVCSYAHLLHDVSELVHMHCVAQAHFA
jgi:hypothetical protein